MKTPLKITLAGMPPSEALDARIRENVEKLELFHSGIVSCRVAVEELDKHQHQGRQFQVRVDVRVPGREIVASRRHDEDVYVALRDAFKAATRRLEDSARVKRGQVKRHNAA